MNKRGNENLFGRILRGRMKSGPVNAYRNQRVRLSLAALVLTSAIGAIPAILSSTGTSVAQSAPPFVSVYVSVSQEAWAPHVDAFVQGMSDLGYVDGETIRYEYRFADSNPDYYEPYAQELVALAPDVIVAGADRSMRILSAATSTIPLVIAHAGEGQFRRVVENLERPEGNITGLMTANIGGPDEVQFAKELIPGATRIGYLIRGDSSNLQANQQAVLEAAATLGVTVILRVVQSPKDAVAAYEAVVAQDVDVMVVSGGPQFIETLPELAAAARTARMPTTYRQTGAVPAGGLISHGRDQVPHWRAAAKLVDRLLRGETPADLSITRSIPLAIRANLTEAKQIGLTIPNSILARATEVIE